MKNIIMSIELSAKKNNMTVEEYKNTIKRKNTNIPVFDLGKFIYKLSEKIFKQGLNFAMNNLNLGMIPQLANITKYQPGKKYLNNITIGMLSGLFGDLIKGDNEDNALQSLNRKIQNDIINIKNTDHKCISYDLHRLNSKFTIMVEPYGSVIVDMNKLKKGYIFPFETFKFGGIDIPKFSFGMNIIIKL